MRESSTLSRPSPRLLPARATEAVVAPRQRAASCGDRLVPMPADSEHDGWTCVQPAGHLAWADHLAADGTTW